METLEKHKKYMKMYGENDVYWGLGIELETYLQFSKPIMAAAPILRTAHKPERYSVNYYKSYKPHVMDLESTFTDASGFYPLPLIVNGHVFTKMDTSLNHETTYEKLPRPNPLFKRSLLHELQEFSSYFKNSHEITFTFDGDTIEFMTQNFYKAKVGATVNELIRYKSDFLYHLQRFMKTKRLHRDKGTLIYPPRNPPFAIFLSNPKNLAIFNNGTYHINITLPSALGYKDSRGNPTLVNPALFREQHKTCIRMYQWLEPFLIAMYGTGDPLGSPASQRCAVSRYIGIGTYDTVAMKPGKILTVPIDQIRGHKQPFWWYSMYHATSAYEPLQEIGMDVNYRKHYLHGIELRLFDWFPEERLQSLINLLIRVAEVSLLHGAIPEPATNKWWNEFVVRVLRKGKTMIFKEKEIAILEYLFKVSVSTIHLDLESIFYEIEKELQNVQGALTKAFL